MYFCALKFLRPKFSYIRKKGSFVHAEKIFPFYASQNSLYIRFNFLATLNFDKNGLKIGLYFIVWILETQSIIIDDDWMTYILPTLREEILAGI